jgi:predicted alpha/beta-fold hydrolase
MDCVIEHLRLKHPLAPLLGVGFSQGGSVLASYLGRRTDNPLVAAACVSSPGDISNIMADLLTLTDRFLPYDFAVAKNILKSNFLDRLKAPRVKEAVRAELRDRLRLHRIFSAPTNGFGAHYHEQVTIKYTGHASAADLFSEVSEYTLQSLPHITTPTLCLWAADDPLQPAHSASALNVLRACESNGHIARVVTDWGGHQGWSKYFDFGYNLRRRWEARGARWQEAGLAESAAAGAAPSIAESMEPGAEHMNWADECVGQFLAEALVCTK